MLPHPTGPSLIGAVAHALQMAGQAEWGPWPTAPGRGAHVTCATLRLARRLTIEATVRW
jgi:hypothetical protein